MPDNTVPRLEYRTRGYWRLLCCGLTLGVLLIGRSAQAETAADRKQTSRAGWIPAQTFRMGDPTGQGDPDQRPRHSVTLSRFYIAPLLVTVQEYCNFLNATDGHREEADFLVGKGGEVLVNVPYSQITKSGRTYVPKPGTARQPLIYVTWEGAASYCNYLSRKESRTPCYHPDSAWACDFSANGYHLPTEAQWECAARGGLTGCAYPWGSTITPKLANYGSQVGHITDVGSYPPNAYGLYDMVGNVMQWCQDWYKFDYYRECESGDRDPLGPGVDELTGHAVRALRGGAYYQPAGFQTCASRYGTADTKGCFSFNGFRVARQEPQTGSLETTSGRTEGSSEEMALRSRWLSANFRALTDKPTPAANLPFSFVLGGQPAAKLLPGWKFTTQTVPAESGKTRRILTVRDPKTGLEIACEITSFARFPAVDWVLRFTNRGTKDTPLLEDVRALNAVFQRDPSEAREFILRHSRGSRASEMDFAPTDDLLEPGSRQTIGGHGGRPSDYALPFMNLSWGSGGVTMALGWSGQWQATFQRDSARGLRVQAGMERTHLILHPGESIRSPRILLVFWKGESLLRGHNLFRQLLLAHYSPRLDGKRISPPISASAAGLNDYTEANQLAVAPKLGARGIEVQWIDAGWFVGGWPNGAGNWTPKPENFPQGLGPVGEAVHAAGMKFLLWFEPERVSRGSRIARKHPQWTIGPITEYGGLFNWGIPEARKWMTDLISDQITQGKVDIFRQDFNMEPLMYWWRNDPPDRQGMTEIRFVEGMYQLWDDLRSRHPGLWIDNCASGGRMFDLETALRSISLTQSDAPYEPDRTFSTAVINQLHNAGLNLYLPLHTNVNFGLEPSYEFRSSLMSGNVLADAPENKTIEAMQPSIELFHRARPYFEGDYYPLFRHKADERSWWGYQLSLPESGRGMVALFRRSHCLIDRVPVLLHAIDSQASYRLTDKDSGETRTLSGSELKALAIRIPEAPGARLLFYERVNGKAGYTKAGKGD